MRLRNWIAVVVSVLLLMAVGVVGVLVNRSALHAADTVHRADTEALAVNNATLAGQMQLLAARELATFAAGRAFRLAAGDAGDQAALDEYVARSTQFAYGAVLTTADGTVLTGTRSHPLPPATDPGYQAMRTLVQADEPAFSPVMTAPDPQGTPVAVRAVAVPLVAGGAPGALLTAFSRLTATTLQDYVAKLKSAAHLTTIVDGAGTVGFSSEAGVVGTKVDPTVVAAAAAHPGGPTFVEYSVGGTRQVAVVVTGDLLPGGWAYVRTQSLASFDGAVHSRSQTINVALLAMLLIGAVGISLLGYRTQVQRRHADERFQALFQHAPDMVAVLDAAGLVAYSSPSAASVLHFPPGSLQGSNVFDLVHPDDRGRMQEMFAELLTRRAGVLRLQTRIRNAAGVPTWFDFTASNQMHNPALAGIVINARDISQTRAFQERLAHEAQHDPLTGLPNRRRLQDALGASLGETAVAVLFVDLDGFKPVNDSYGHEAGDDLLRQVAARLSACVRGQDVLARVGGDEFVVLMPGIAVPDDAVAMSSRVRAAIERPFRVLSHEVRISASVGVHLAAATSDPDQALRAADHAMYAVKRHAPTRRESGAGAGAGAGRELGTVRTAPGWPAGVPASTGAPAGSGRHRVRE